MDLLLQQMFPILQFASLLLIYDFRLSSDRKQ